MPEVEIVEYRSEWPAEFLLLRDQLLALLRDLPLQVEHIGSTSVPGLAAKDVIDVQVGARDDATLQQAAERLAALAFPLRLPARDHYVTGEDPDPRQWTKAFTRQPEGWRRCNIHLRVEGRANWRYALLFRDFLRAHPDTAAAYAAFKARASVLLPDDVDTYAELKDPVCDLVYLPARAWAERSGWQPSRLGGAEDSTVSPTAR